MKKFTFKFIFLILSFGFLAIGLIGISRLSQRAKLPFNWNYSQSKVTIKGSEHKDQEVLKEIEAGDILVEFNHWKIQNSNDLKFMIDGTLSGSEAEIVLQRNNILFKIIVKLPPRWDTSFIIINLVLGILIWFVGIIVFLNGSSVYSHRIFLLLCIVVSTAIMMVWHRYPYNSDPIEYGLSIIYFILYPLLPFIVLYFFSIYPEKQQIIKKNPNLKYISFIPCIIIICLLQISHFLALKYKTIGMIQLFYNSLIVFRIYLFSYLLLGILCLANSYLKIRTSENRRKIQWILWGFSAGLAPFLFLWTIPLALNSSPLIPEEMNFLFMILIPVGFAFSILKYRAFDIEIIINRSIVYLIITGLILISYLILIGAASYIVGSVSPQNISIIVAISCTLLVTVFISPFKRKIQDLVDKIFYRVKYNYRIALKEYTRDLFLVYDRIGLIKLFNDRITQLLPVEKIILYLYDPVKEGYEIIGSSDIIGEETEINQFRKESELVKTISHLQLPVVKKGRSECRELIQLELFPELVRSGIELVIPVIIQKELQGFLMLGRKLSETRFLQEDIELISAMTSESYIVYERLSLLEKMILERTENERLEKINELKSEFISHVSHELRTPLTSISWSVENLLDGIPELPSPAISEYLEGIHESSEHLGRMIMNLLDISRIEAGKIDLRLQTLELKDEIQRACTLLEPIAKKRKIQFNLQELRNFKIIADPDFLLNIITNLLENAIKYSIQGDDVQILSSFDDKTSNKKAEEVLISIIDHGPGIHPDKGEYIFERFERIKKGRNLHKKGLGLGLYIVKKLVQLHGGRIWLESEKNKGGTFKFTLPVKSNYE